MTGRRNRAHAAAKFGKLCLPNWFFPPCAPADLSRRESRYLPRLRGKYFFLLALLWIKKLDTEDFKLKRTAARFSANIIWLLFYLFAENPGLRGTLGYRGVVGADPYMVVRDSLS